MSMNNKVYQIDVECALHDVMNVICKHADVKSLLNIARVCKSWRYAALRERNNRYYVQQLSLPYNTGNLASTLNVIPLAALLIYDSTLEKSLSLPITPRSTGLSNGLEKELLEDFKKQLPNKTIVLKVEEYLTTENPEFQTNKERCDPESTNKCSTLGFFFPSVRRRIRVDVTWFQDTPVFPNRWDEYEDELVNRLAEGLGLNDCEYPKSSILLIAMPWSNDNAFVGELCKRAQQKGKEITLASLFGNRLVMDCHCRSDSTANTTVLLRISGPSVESWSTFIHYLARHDEIEQRLQKLKEKVKPKRCYTGLIYVPTCAHPGCSHIEHPCGNSREMMHTLKRTFPHIPFTGLFENCDMYPPIIRNEFNLSFPDVYDENDPFSDFYFFETLNLYVSIFIIAYD